MTFVSTTFLCSFLRVFEIGQSSKVNFFNCWMTALFDIFFLSIVVSNADEHLPIYAAIKSELSPKTLQKKCEIISMHRKSAT